MKSLIENLKKMQMGKFVFYLWAILITVCVIGIIGFFVLNHKVLDLKDTDRLAEKFITYSAIIFGFPLIVLYTLFNTTIEDRRQYSKEILKDLVSKSERQIDEKYEGNMKKGSEVIRIHENFFKLTYQYSTPLTRYQAVDDFSRIPVNQIENFFKDSIKLYYESILNNKENEMFYNKLKQLVESWSLVK